MLYKLPLIFCHQSSEWPLFWTLLFEHDACVMTSFCMLLSSPFSAVAVYRYAHRIKSSACSLHCVHRTVGMVVFYTFPLHVFTWPFFIALLVGVFIVIRGHWKRDGKSFLVTRVAPPDRCQWSSKKNNPSFSAQNLQKKNDKENVFL